MKKMNKSEINAKEVSQGTVSYEYADLIRRANQNCNIETQFPGSRFLGKFL